MELFDPVTRTFSLGGKHGAGRFSHTATLLANGKVLFAGGYFGGGGGASSVCQTRVELYDPGTATFTTVPGLASYQCDHTATVLANGRVLIVGRYPDARAELFDPATETFTATGTMVEVRIRHTATLLNDGRVLVAGGVANPVRYVATAEVYDPSTGLFSAVGNLSVPRAAHTASVLPNGKVLIAGGLETYLSTGPVFRPNAEIYDAVTNTFAAGPPSAFLQSGATATGLVDNRILIVGGTSATQIQTVSCQHYDPASGTFSVDSNLAVGRYGHTANLLPSGGVLIVGGRVALAVQTVPAEIYE